MSDKDWPIYRIFNFPPFGDSRLYRHGHTNKSIPPGDIGEGLDFCCLSRAGSALGKPWAEPPCPAGPWDSLLSSFLSLYIQVFASLLHLVISALSRDVNVNANRATENEGSPCILF